MLDSFRRFGTVGGATALALAIVLTGMLLVAATLPLAVVLTLAGVLGQSLVVDQEDPGVCGLDGGSVRLGRLGIQTNRRATDHTCERGGQSERFYCVGHWEAFHWLSRAWGRGPLGLTAKSRSGRGNRSGGREFFIRTSFTQPRFLCELQIGVVEGAKVTTTNRNNAKSVFRADIQPPWI